MTVPRRAVEVPGRDGVAIAEARVAARPVR